MQSTLARTKERLWLETVGLIILAFVVAAPAHAVNAPNISPATGSFTSEQKVTITAASGTIYYTIDGTVPTTASTQYVAPFYVDDPTQVNAVAYSSGLYSPVTTVYLDVDPALTPVLQSGLSLRLRAGLGVKTAGGVPSQVLQWYDLSGNSNNAVADADSRPTFLNSGMNGMPAINFNGTSQFLSLASDFAILNGSSMFVVTKPTTVTSGARMIDIGSAGLSINLLFRVANSGSYGEFWSYNGPSSSSAQSPSALTAGAIQVLDAVQSVNTATCYLNGLPGSANSSMPTIPNLTRYTNSIGRAGTGGSYYEGNLAEILVYSSALSASQRNAIETYFLQKYRVLEQGPAAPIISVPGGTLPGPTQVVVSSQPGSTTFITRDGTTPSSSSPVYTGCPMNVTYSQTLKAISIKNGVQSSVTSETYTLDSSQWPAPNPGDTTAPSINLELPTPTQ
jgi:hypothetical protein